MAKKQKTLLTIFLMNIITGFIVGTFFFAVQQQVFDVPDSDKAIFVNQRGEQSWKENDAIDLKPTFICPNGHPAGGMAVSGTNYDLSLYPQFQRAFDDAEGSTEIYYIDDRFCGVEKCENVQAGTHFVEVVYGLSCPFIGAYGIHYESQRITVEAPPCVLDANQVLAVESFSTDFSKNSLRFPAVKYCSIHPPIVVDRFTLTSYTDLSIITKLENLQTINVPSDKVISVFYVIENDGSIPIACDPLTEAYDVEEGRCVDSIGFVQICSQGSFDPATGICVTFPDSEIICEIGRYDVVLQQCIYNPPVSAICERGTYNADLNLCVFTPDIVNECSRGTYNPTTNTCIYTPATEGICEIGTFNPSTNTCEFIADISNVCTQGSFDETIGMCVIVPPTAFQCPIGVYNEALNVCIFEPSLNILCPQGSYDRDRNACVVTPSTEFLCTVGDLTTVEGQQKCVITPETRIVCHLGFTYNQNTNKCEKAVEGEEVIQEARIPADATSSQVLNQAKTKEGIKFNILFIIIPFVLVNFGIILWLILRKKKK